MRGLDTRVLLANARIMRLVDAHKASVLMAVVERLAEKDGMTDAANGVHTMPVMFDDELLLASQWCAGQKRHAQDLNKAQWRMLCEKLAADAKHGCGLSYVDAMATAIELVTRRSSSASRPLSITPTMATACMASKWAAAPLGATTPTSMLNAIFDPEIFLDGQDRCVDE